MKCNANQIKLKFKIGYSLLKQIPLNKVLYNNFNSNNRLPYSNKYLIILSKIKIIFKYSNEIIRVNKVSNNNL